MNNESMEALKNLENLKKLENELNEICKKGGYPTYDGLSDIVKEIKEKFQIVKVNKADNCPDINTLIIPKDVRIKDPNYTTTSLKNGVDFNYIYNNPHISLNYDIDMLVEGPEYPYVMGDVLINKYIGSKNKLIMVYLDHPPIDRRTVLHPAIECLNDLRNITDCFVPYKSLIFKINIDDDGVEYVEYSRLALSHGDLNDGVHVYINDAYLDIRNYELLSVYTDQRTGLLHKIEETNPYKHYDCINKISTLAKRGYEMNYIEDYYREFLKDLNIKEEK